MRIEPESAAAASAPALPSRLASMFAALHEQSGAWQFGMDREAFAGMLLEVGARYLPQDGSGPDPLQFYSSLHVAELALTRACVAGHELAWELFLTRYRERLYEMARAIAHDDSQARELADSLYAELYGLQTRAGQRTSRLRYYQGRGSLEGWLRTVLAQEFVNRYRARRQLVSLEESEEGGTQYAASEAEPVTITDPRLNAAVDHTLAALPADERFLLAAYYLDGRTLAQVAQMLGVHESTVSRRLDRLVHTIRRSIMKRLVEGGMSRRQAEEALDADVRDLAINVRAHLGAKPPPAEGSSFSAQEPPAAPFSQQDTRRAEESAGQERNSTENYD